MFKTLSQILFRRKAQPAIPAAPTEEIFIHEPAAKTAPKAAAEQPAEPAPVIAAEETKPLTPDEFLQASLGEVKRLVEQANRDGYWVGLEADDSEMLPRLNGETEVRMRGRFVFETPDRKPVLFSVSTHDCFYAKKPCFAMWMTSVDVSQYDIENPSDAGSWKISGNRVNLADAFPAFISNLHLERKDVTRFAGFKLHPEFKPG